MSEFKAIETQAELDNVLKERMARQKESIESQFKDYDQLKTRNAELEKDNESLRTTAKESESKHEQAVSDLNAKIAGYETASLRTRIALKNGLPLDLADRLVGDDEASITADAERLASFVKPKDPIAPLKDTEDPKNTENGGFKNLIEGLNLEGE